MNDGQEGRPGGAVPSLPERWSAASRHAANSSGRLLEGLLEANRAALAAVGLSTPDATDDGEPPLPDAGTAYREPAWSFERTVDSFEDLGVGGSVSFTKRLGDDDVGAFATASGDTNRLHLDDAFAGRTRFGGRIVHGTLLSGLISAALARLPGLTIYLSQDLEFLGPVRVGETVTADCEIVEDLGGDRYRLVTEVSTEDGETVIDGEAVVLVDELPEDRDASGPAPN